MERPGIMVYFDLRPQLEEYSEEEVGKLFLAMLDFGANGSVPSFDDRGMRIIWREVQRKIERDNESYQKRVMDGAYGAYKRDEEKRGRKPLSKDAWIKTKWVPSQEGVDSMPMCTSEHLMSAEQLEPELGTGTTTKTGTGIRARDGEGTGEGDGDSASFEQKRQAALRRFQGGF